MSLSEVLWLRAVLGAPSLVDTSLQALPLILPESGCRIFLSFLWRALVDGRRAHSNCRMISSRDP